MSTMLSLFLFLTSASRADTPDFSKQHPVDLLKYLQKHCCAAVTVMITKEDWITEADVQQLKKYLHDNRPAAPVYNPLSSRLCTGKSTVKREALYLIRGFQEKRYPPDLCSTDFKWKSVKVPR